MLHAQCRTGDISTRVFWSIKNDMDKVYLALRPSERVVTHCAAEIFAAYIRTGLVREGSEKDWIKRSVQEAIEIARLADALITSDDEMS
jgi:hypothetical protein